MFEQAAGFLEIQGESLFAAQPMTSNACRLLAEFDVGTMMLLLKNGLSLFQQGRRA